MWPGLYKKKLKDELLKYIWPKASKKVPDKINIKELRDEIFALLVKHGYLVENHPKSASGSESLRTSYSVGPHYQKSLQDYFNTRQESLSDNISEINHGNDSDILNLIQEETNTDIINREKFHKIYLKQYSDINWDVFQMYVSNEEREFGKALEIGKKLIKNYIINLHQSYLKFDNKPIPEIENPEFFFVHLANNKLFPLSVENIKEYYRKSKQIISSDNEVEKKAKNLFELLLKFCSYLQSYI